MNSVNNNPKVTVFMPVYNGEKYLREAIDSILNQTFTDFEFLIINDGSTDSSVEIINSYDDSRIRLIHNEKNLKLVATLNKGLDLARGKYIARMDCDDISLPDCAGAAVLANQNADKAGVNNANANVKTKAKGHSGFIVSDGQGQLTALTVNHLATAELARVDNVERIFIDSKCHLMSFDNHLQAL